MSLVNDKHLDADVAVINALSEGVWVAVLGLLTVWGNPWTILLTLTCFLGKDNFVPNIPMMCQSPTV
jgi:hypothetical protein